MGSFFIIIIIAGLAAIIKPAVIINLIFSLFLFVCSFLLLWLLFSLSWYSWSQDVWSVIPFFFFFLFLLFRFVPALVLISSLYSLPSLLSSSFYSVWIVTLFFSFPFLFFVLFLFLFLFCCCYFHHYHRGLPASITCGLHCYSSLFSSFFLFVMFVVFVSCRIHHHCGLRSLYNPRSVMIFFLSVLFLFSFCHICSLRFLLFSSSSS